MKLRTASDLDAAEILKIYRPIVEKTVISFEYIPPTEADMGTRIRKILERFPWIVAEIDNDVLGYAYASSHRDRSAYQWSCDVSVYIAMDYRRKGVGKALYERLFEILKLLGYVNVFAGITLPNDASVRLHEHMRMRQIATYHNVGFKNGRWHDVGWWQGELREFESKPAPPRLFSNLTQPNLK